MTQTTAPLTGGDPPSALDDPSGDPQAALDEAVREATGIERLREGQREAIEAALAGDTVAVLASGTGKTAIYETLGYLLDGPTVVVSPTLALQRDQVQSLREDGHAAASVSSARGVRGRREALEQFSRGELEFLLMAPEQLANEEVLEQVAAGKPSLFVVDEAHCLSEWGHDFRPDYLSLGQAVQALRHPRVLALTATAAPRVRRDIVERLGMRDASLVVGAADRPAIWLGGRLFSDARERDDALVDAVLATEGAVIVYAPTRRRCEELAALVIAGGDRSTEGQGGGGRPALVYHAGLPGRRRKEVQDAFLQDGAGEDAGSEVIVATNAFGMGVDRPDVRAVYHAGPATSVDEYFQEVGRAGRDREPARAELFFRLEDFALGRYLESGGGAREEDLAAVVRTLARAAEEGQGRVPQAELARRTGLNRRRLALAVGTLQAGKALLRRKAGLELAAAARRDPAAVVAEAVAERDRRREFDGSRLDMMRAYAETTDCRRRVILELLGESHPHRCGHCDNCDAGTSTESGERPFPIGATVEHAEWGRGTVSHYEGDRVVVLLADLGYRTLSLPLVLEKGLLTLVG